MLYPAVTSKLLDLELLSEPVEGRPIGTLDSEVDVLGLATYIDLVTELQP